MKHPEEISSREYRKLKIKKPKYGNRKAEYNGIPFDSQKECDRYKELLLLEAVGEVRDLELQKRFELIPGFPAVGNIPKQQACYYVCDFSYWEKVPFSELSKEAQESHIKFGMDISCKWARVVEDVKSAPTKTAVYKLKKKIMRAKGYIVRET